MKLHDLIVELCNVVVKKDMLRALSGAMQTRNPAHVLDILEREIKTIRRELEVEAKHARRQRSALNSSTRRIERDPEEKSTASSE